MQNKSKTNTVLLVIIIILLAVGLVYIFFNNSKQKENNLVNNLPQESQNNTDNKIESNKSLETYKSLQAGYEVSYPKNWYPDEMQNLGNELANNNTFRIKNKPDAVKQGGDFVMLENGSMISVEVNSDMNYSTYEEFIRSPKLSLSEKIINQRLASMGNLVIDGKKFQAFMGIKTSDSLPMETYSFIYNSNLYNISYISGSKKQFDLDHQVFSDFILSFHFL